MGGKYFSCIFYLIYLLVLFLFRKIVTTLIQIVSGNMLYTSLARCNKLEKYVVTLLNILNRHSLLDSSAGIPCATLPHLVRPPNTEQTGMAFYLTSLTFSQWVITTLSIQKGDNAQYRRSFSNIFDRRLALDKTLK